MDKRLADDLKIFEQGEQHLNDFLVITLEFIHGNTERKKSFSKAAKVMAVSKPQIENAIIGLSKALQECCMFSESYFNTQMLNIGVPASVSLTIWSFFTENEDEIKELFASRKSPCVKYKDLNWRLEVEESSRFCSDSGTPRFFLTLDSIDSLGIEQTSMTSSLATLSHVHRELTSALDQLNSVHSERVMRYVR